MRTRTKIITAIAAVIAGCAVITLAASNYLVNYALDSDFPVDMFSNQSYSDPEYEAWLDGAMAEIEAHSEEIYIENDGLKLHGYLSVQKPGPGARWAVAVHGYKASARDMAPYALHYYTEGWNVLLIDQRAHGKSEGRYIGMGALEKKDLLAWLNFILTRDSAARVIFHGVSMGAATLMQLTGESLPANVCALIEDAGYVSAKEQFTDELKKQFGLPPFPIIPTASLLTQLKAGWNFEETDARESLEKSSIPMLFIHGTADTFVPFSQMEEAYAAKSPPKERFAVEGAVHARALTTAGDAYWQRVEDFIKTSLAEGGTIP